MLQNDDVSKSYVPQEIQESISRLSDGSFELHGLPSPQKTLASLVDQHDEQEHVFKELLLNAIEVITKFSE